MADEAMTSDFTLVEHTEGDAVVLAASGELDLRSSPRLEARLERLLQDGPDLVIFDLRQSEFMDSTGLRVLLSTHQRARERGKRK
jgi:anti-sigma B factor antagonist